jgi:hypothetical protein
MNYGLRNAGFITMNRIGAEPLEDVQKQRQSISGPLVLNAAGFNPCRGAGN